MQLQLLTSAINYLVSRNFSVSSMHGSVTEWCCLVFIIQYLVIIVKYLLWIMLHLALIIQCLPSIIQYMLWMIQYLVIITDVFSICSEWFILYNEKFSKSWMNYTLPPWGVSRWLSICSSLPVLLLSSSASTRLLCHLHSHVLALAAGRQMLDFFFFFWWGNMERSEFVDFYLTNYGNRMLQILFIRMLWFFFFWRQKLQSLITTYRTGV